MAQKKMKRSYIELLTDDISIREIGATGLPPGATYTEFLITTTPKINDWSKTEEKRDYEITSICNRSCR